MGKSGGSAPPVPTQDDSGMEMMMGMMEMMGGMMESQNEEVIMPDIIETPEVVQTEAVDWAQQMEDLGNKARYDTEEIDTERKGRLSTIHSSLTDDDEETEMSGSLLGGEPSV